MYAPHPVIVHKLVQLRVAERRAEASASRAARRVRARKRDTR
jgi:hypothetical protein